MSEFAQAWWIKSAQDIVNVFVLISSEGNKGTRGNQLRTNEVSHKNAL
jgi:hypothetical protein